MAGIRDGAGFHADNVIDLQTASHEAVDDSIETWARIGKDPQKPHLGKVMFHLAPEVHRKAALAAEPAGRIRTMILGLLNPLSVLRVLDVVNVWNHSHC